MSFVDELLTHRRRPDSNKRFLADCLRGETLKGSLAPIHRVPLHADDFRETRRVARASAEARALRAAAAEAEKEARLLSVPLTMQFPDSDDEEQSGQGTATAKATGIKRSLRQVQKERNRQKVTNGGINKREEEKGGGKKKKKKATPEKSGTSDNRKTVAAREKRERMLRFAENARRELSASRNKAKSQHRPGQQSQRTKSAEGRRHRFSSSVSKGKADFYEKMVKRLEEGGGQNPS